MAEHQDQVPMAFQVDTHLELKQWVQFRNLGNG
jgi:hypothetical protein